MGQGRIKPTVPVRGRENSANREGPIFLGPGGVIKGTPLNQQQLGVHREEIVCEKEGAFRFHGVVEESSLSEIKID